MALEAETYTQGYVHGQELRAECAPAPLNEQVQALLDGLREMAGMLEGLEAALPIKAIQPDRPGRVEGLTALVAACHQELDSLRRLTGSIAQRIGRL